MAPELNQPAARTVEAAVALASLPDMGPGRLAAIAFAYGFDEAWQRAKRGAGFDHPSVVRSLGTKAADVVASWRRAAAGIDAPALVAAHAAANIEIHLLGGVSYPAALAADIDPPAVLFTRGDLNALDGPKVAIVGTRRCTQAGRLVARDMGRDLADAGIKVVSGLALGIDGAAHEGALGPQRPLSTIAVVGTGLETIYPKRHRHLWEAVGNQGLLMSEVPIGGVGFPWRFPARNRVIAAVADLVVVVESHAKGGALHTADEAIRRDIPVLAVPGSVRSPAAAGTNGLLYDGIGPARDAADVMAALGFSHRVDAAEATAHHGGPPSAPGGAQAVERVSELPLDPQLQAVLEHLDSSSTSVDRLSLLTGLDLSTLALALMSLEKLGLVARSGSWVERVA